MGGKIDILDRQPFVDRLIEIVRLIADNGRGCTFTIDGRWGCGKSFVLDMFEKQIKRKSTIMKILMKYLDEYELKTLIKIIKIINLILKTFG